MLPCLILAVNLIFLDITQSSIYCIVFILNTQYPLTYNPINLSFQYSFIIWPLQPVSYKKIWSHNLSVDDQAESTVEATL
jgi:hypothetical protein